MTAVVPSRPRSQLPAGDDHARPEATGRGRAGKVLTLVAALVLILSAFLPWFTSHVDAASRNINGMFKGSGNAWLLGIPIGWLLLVVALGSLYWLLSDRLAGRTRLPSWRLPAVAEAIIGVALGGFILLERRYVHHQVQLDLQRVFNSYVAAHPELKDRVQATLLSGRLHLDDAIGSRVALVGAVLLVVAGVLRARSERLGRS